MTDYVEENKMTNKNVAEEPPAWKTLLGQIKSLTKDQALELSAAWGTAWGVSQFDTWDSIQRDAWITAWSAARSAARDAGRSADWGTAQSSVRTAVLDAAWDAAWDTALDAALDAVRGLLVIDLEPDVAEILLAPWVSVMGHSWEVAA